MLSFVEQGLCQKVSPGIGCSFISISRHISVNDVEIGYEITHRYTSNIVGVEYGL